LDRGGRAAFSLVEMVIVVAVIGAIAAIAVPRVNQGVRRARTGALQATIGSVRTAIETYYAEHGAFPGKKASNGSLDGEVFVEQPARYSDEKGSTNATASARYRFGPYLRLPFPKNPFNGSSAVHVKLRPGDANPADGSAGWVAVVSDGSFGILAKTTEMQASGIDATLIGRLRAP
jgi:prepilin-type N-terminal cleavage/methylation domain-containing protein